MQGRNEKGIALIIVLWTTALLSIIAITVSRETQIDDRIARKMADHAAAEAAADAGIERAILDLLAPANAQIATERFSPDGTVYSWQFAVSAVQISVQDEAGKIDLNQAPAPLLATLLTSLGVGRTKALSLASAIADFRDPDDLTRPYGAEAIEYQAAHLPWGPKNAPFEGVEELQQVLGMTPQIYERVAPYLTVYSVDGIINRALASDPLPEVLQQAGGDGLNLAASGGIVYSIRSEADGPNGAVFVREATVQPLQNDQVLVLSWREDRAARIAGSAP